MRVLVVYAHPAPSSFVGALHRRIVEIVSERGHEVDELDLYAEKFDPVMSRHTYDCYLDTVANREGVAPYVERLLAAGALILVYPVWHDGLPAILKGYIDRVFLPGVAFEIDEKGVFRPILQNIRRLAAVATYGASRRRTSHVGDLPRRFFMRNLGDLIAPRRAHPIYRGLRRGRRHTSPTRAICRARCPHFQGLVSDAAGERRRNAARPQLRHAAATQARLLARRCRSEAIISVTTGVPLISPRT